MKFGLLFLALILPAAAQPLEGRPLWGLCSPCPMKMVGKNPPKSLKEPANQAFRIEVEGGGSGREFLFPLPSCMPEVPVVRLAKRNIECRFPQKPKSPKKAPHRQPLPPGAKEVIQVESDGLPEIEENGGVESAPRVDEGEFVHALLIGPPGGAMDGLARALVRMDSLRYEIQERPDKAEIDQPGQGNGSPSEKLEKKRFREREQRKFRYWFARASARELPQFWQAYRGIDRYLICTSQSNTIPPEARQAILDRVRLGGTLVLVSDNSPGDGFENEWPWRKGKLRPDSHLVRVPRSPEDHPVPCLWTAAWRPLGRGTVVGFIPPAQASPSDTILAYQPWLWTQILPRVLPSHFTMSTLQGEVAEDTTVAMDLGPGRYILVIWGGVMVLCYLANATGRETLFLLCLPGLLLVVALLLPPPAPEGQELRSSVPPREPRQFETEVLWLGNGDARAVVTHSLDLTQVPLGSQFEVSCPGTQWLQLERELRDQPFTFVDGPKGYRYRNLTFPDSGRCNIATIQLRTLPGPLSFRCRRGRFWEFENQTGLAFSGCRLRQGPLVIRRRGPEDAERTRGFLSRTFELPLGRGEVFLLPQRGQAQDVPLLPRVLPGEEKTTLSGTYRKIAFPSQIQLTWAEPLQFLLERVGIFQLEMEPEESL